jgi:hypothetical protein
MGDKKRALDYLEKALVRKNFWMAFTGVDPFYDGLRSEPRYRETLRKMNLTRWFETTAASRITAASVQKERSAG